MAFIIIKENRFVIDAMTDKPKKFRTRTAAGSYAQLSFGTFGYKYEIKEEKK